MRNLAPNPFDGSRLKLVDTSATRDAIHCTRMFADASGCEPNCDRNGQFCLPIRIPIRIRGCNRVGSHIGIRGLGAFCVIEGETNSSWFASQRSFNWQVLCVCRASMATKLLAPSCELIAPPPNPSPQRLLTLESLCVCIYLAIYLASYPCIHLAYI